MPSPEDIFREIEEDRAVREREIRLIENASRRASTDDERNMLLRVSVLITYAHLEGFCRFALSAYVSAINSLKVRCEEASVPLVAATLTRALAALRNPSSKHPVFAGIAPDDSKLHLMAREREFVEKLGELLGQHVELSDTVVDTESNLSSIVLKKNLYRLGLAFPVVDERKGEIDMLLGMRNAIAHGDTLKVPKAEQNEEYVRAAFKVMQFVQYEIFESLRQRSYLRSIA